MNDIKQEMQELIKIQDDLRGRLTEVSREISSDRLAGENRRLAEELDRAKPELETLRKTNKKLSDENSRLRSSVSEQIISEKMNILNTVNNKNKVLFQREADAELNSLDIFERNSRARLTAMKKAANEYIKDAADPIYAKFTELEGFLNAGILSAREKLKQTISDADSQNGLEMQAIMNEGLTEEQLQRRIKQNNIEKTVGSGWINKLGILFIIIGIVTASQYFSRFFSDYLKAGFSFLLGAAFLAAGEYMNKRVRSVFSLGITGGGVAILYTALFLSYFTFGIMPPPAALLLAVATAAVAFMLSHRYNSQTIFALALLGAYTPIIQLQPVNIALYIAMCYFFALNIFTFVMSMYKRWTAVNYFSLFCNLLAMSYIIHILAPAGMLIPKILYVTLTFAMYTGIIIINPIRSKEPLDRHDIILLAIATVYSFATDYALFSRTYAGSLNGLLAIVFAVIFISLAYVFAKQIPGDRRSFNLLSLAAFAFCLMAVLFQFGVTTFSIGWQLMAVSLLVFAILYRDVWFERVGVIILVMCYAAFFLVDTSRSTFFAWKFSLLALSSWLVTILYALDQKREGYTFTGRDKMIKAVKIITVVFGYFYSLYMTWLVLDRLDAAITGKHIAAAVIIATFGCISILYGYAVRRINLIADRFTRIFGFIAYSIGIFIIVMTNFAQYPRTNDIFALPFIIIYNILALLALYELTAAVTRRARSGRELTPLLTALYLLFALTQNIICYGGVRLDNFVLSLVYLVMALLLIAAGFLRGYSYLRKFGLALSIFAVAKLFIFDLRYLSSGYRIIAYFAFGLILITISYTYHYFDKKYRLRDDDHEKNKEADI